MSNQINAYRSAQIALAGLKGAIYELLASDFAHGLTNSEIGRALGIYHGHIGHEGHIPRTLLGMMEAEGVVQQDKSTKRWNLIAINGEEKPTRHEPPDSA